MVLVRNLIVTWVSALCTKVFEYVILNMHSDSLISNNLQFAYKAGTSTTQCTWAAHEVISYYNNKGSDVYCCLMVKLELNGTKRYLNILMFQMVSGRVQYFHLICLVYIY